MSKTHFLDILWAPYKNTPTAMSRRAFLGRMGGVLAATYGASILAACGGSSESSTPNATGIGGNLNILTWEGYPLEQETAAWRSKHGVTQEATYIATQDDVQTKLSAASAPAFDLSTYNQGYNQLYVDLDLMIPLDEAKLPNYNSSAIFPEFYKTDWWYFDNKLWAVPFNWGGYPLLYNPKYVEPPDSWEALLSNKFKGKLGILDDPLATWPAAARIAGFGDEFPNVTRDDLKQIMDNMELYKKNARSIIATYGDLTNQFVSGEIIASFAAWAAVNVWTAQQGVETSAVVPKEGASSWSDAWFLPKTATNVETATAWINDVVSASTQAQMAINLAGGVVNKNAVSLLDESTRALYPYDAISDYLASAPLYGLPPRVSDEYATFDDWVSAWQAFKV